MPLEWQLLSDLVKAHAAETKEAYKAAHSAPVLIELNVEAGEAPSAGETRALSKTPEEAAPTLGRSKVISLDAGQAFTLGRGGCEIRCMHETVSDRHCVFERFGSMWSIKDAGSKNGTSLNGRRLGADEQVPLKFGSKLVLGEAQFQFLSPDDFYELMQELSREPRIRPQSLGKFTTHFKAAGSMDKILEQFPGPFLVVQAPKGRDAAAEKGDGVSSNTITLSAEDLKKGVNKNVTDAVFHLAEHNLVRIGRATVTQIHLPLGAISNLHAALVRGDAGKWFCQDLGAKNGTYLWGERLEGKRELESGTEIMLGNIKSIFFSTADFLTYAEHRDTLVS